MAKGVAKISLEHLPTLIEQNVQRIADELHIPRDEALLKVIEAGITVHAPEAVASRIPEQSSLLEEALSKVKQVRAERVQELAALSARNESAAKLIGFLKDEPEIVDAIRQASQEHRQVIYGLRWCRPFIGSSGRAIVGELLSSQRGIEPRARR